MVLPGLLTLAPPIIVGVTFKFVPGMSSGAEPVAALLMIGTIGGILMATFMNNGGGAWDNAKKYIESGEFHDPDGTVVSKGSSTHAASVVGDTVGDPFKDTVGPSYNVMVKLIATVTLVLAPIFV